MARYCPNCQRPVLPSDTSCWQCGTNLTTAEAKPPAEKPPPKATETKQRLPALEPLPPGQAIVAPDTAGPPPVLIYGLLTIGLLVAALLLLNQLAMPPLIQATWDDQPPPRWSAVTAPDYQFTLNVPDAWQWQIASRHDEITAVTDEQRARITRPWDDLTNEWRTLFWATPRPDPNQAEAERAQPFVLVLQSDTLRDLTTDEALAYISQPPAEEGLTLSNPFIEDNDKRTYLSVTTAVSGLRCRQHYVHGRAASLLVVGCAPGVAFGQNLRTLTPILESFEYLRRYE